MKTITVFRKFKGGDILALFPFEDWGNGFCASYMHVGQHGPADYLAMIQNSKPAKPEEYNDLLQELTSMGYDCDIRQRKPLRNQNETHTNWDDFTKAVTSMLTKK